MKNSPRRFRPLLIAAGVVLCALPSAMSLLAEDAPVVLASKVATQPTTAATAPNPTKKDARREEEISRVMDFFKQTQPDVYEQALKLRDSDPARFEKVIREASGTVKRLDELRRNKPKLFDLTMKDLTLNYRSVRLAREAKRTDLTPEQRDRNTKELQKVVEEQFSLRQQIRQFEIDEAAQRVRDLENALKDRDKVKADLIKKRVEELLEKPPRLDW